MEETRASRFRQGLKGDAEVEDIVSVASDATTAPAICSQRVRIRGGLLAGGWAVGVSARPPFSWMVLRMWLVLFCDLLDAFQCFGANENKERDGEYYAMSHPVIHTIAARAAQDTGADVVRGWADAGALVVGTRVGPRSFAWYV